MSDRADPAVGDFPCCDFPIFLRQWSYRPDSATPPPDDVRSGMRIAFFSKRVMNESQSNFMTFQ